MNWTNRPIRNARGELIEILAVGSDITAMKLAEDSLRQKQRQLEDANRELESFSYSVSHDLQSPLRAIDGFTRMILRRSGGQFDEETIREFEIIRTSVKQMGQLITDLLAFSRLGKRSLSVARVDVAEIIREIWQELMAINPERSMTLKLNALPSCFADRALLRQVIGNILSNVIKFSQMKDEAVIKAGALEEPDETVYFIRDNGVGFDMTYKNKLFRIFQTLHDRKRYEGTGVGMAIAHRIITRHGGPIWAEGEPDRGATFYFTLPDH